MLRRRFKYWGNRLPDPAGTEEEARDLDREKPLRILPQLPQIEPLAQIELAHAEPTQPQPMKPQLPHPQPAQSEPARPESTQPPHTRPEGAQPDTNPSVADAGPPPPPYRPSIRDCPWIDNDACPHIINVIVQHAPMRLLATFRLVSRRHLRLVDTLLAEHLVLEGSLYSDFPRRTAKAALHNSMRFLVTDHVIYHDESTEDHYSFGFGCGLTGKAAGSPPIHIPRLAGTQVLDVRGCVRQRVIAGLSPLLPDLQTVRISSRTQGLSEWDIGYNTDPKYTVCYGFQDSDPPPPHIIPISARRLVNFATLVPFPQGKSGLVNYYTPNVEELIVCVSFADICEGRPEWIPTPSPPPSLRRATIIFVEEADVSVEAADMLSRGVDREGDNDDLTLFLPFLAEQALKPLGVPLTIVGLERLAGNISLSLYQDVSEIRDVIEHACGPDITVVDSCEYRHSVGEHNWNLYTREVPVVKRLLDFRRPRNERWKFGTALRDRMEWLGEGTG